MLILLMGLVFIVGMNRFIDGYYYGKKIETMNRIISDIDKMYKVSSSEDEALMNIEYMGYHFEGKISIFDRNTKKVIFDSKRYQYTEGIILQELSHGEHTAYIYETEYPVKGARWLIYIDQLENGKIAVLQIPVVAIDEAISVLNVFFNYLMMVALTIAVILAFILSKNISSPICQLRKVADSIEKLDFDVKYEGKRADEIGQLGTRLNQISDTLQKNICDLHRELEKEKNIDRMRRRFVAQVSHELQTPITIISSYMEALSDGIVEEEEIPGYYKVIEDESEKMSKIIKDLLQLSQLEAGTFHFKMESFDLVELLRRILDRYQIMAEQKGIEFRSDLATIQTMEFYGDPLRLEQGVTNILSNGLKHSDGYLAVDLTEEIDRIILSIENSGEMIDNHDLDHIFESFYKGKTSLKKEGTGLGLSIASKIFNRHNIVYKVSNTEQGVVFQMIFNRDESRMQSQ